MSKLTEAVAQSQGRPLIGIAAYRNDPAFVEIVGHLGFDIVWIEMEHAHITFDQAANMCRTAENAGLMTMIRIPDATRENVLRSAECGPDILDLPMANSRGTVEDLVKYGKYPPIGKRGFFGASRAVNYTISGSIADEQKRINEELCLMAQIETVEAVECIDDICSVPGLDAIFIGLGDLSASMGITGDVANPKVRRVAENVIKIARDAGKIVAIVGSPADVPHWVSNGADVCFIASDILCLRTGAKAMIDAVRGK